MTTSKAKWSETVTTSNTKTNGKKKKLVLDNTEETTKQILTSISVSLVEIAESLSSLNANIETLAERFELVTGTYKTGGETGFVRVVDG